MQKDKIKSYLKLVNPKYDEIDTQIVDFTIDEVIDRVKLYLKRVDIPENIERILAQVINQGLIKALKGREMATNNEVDRAISSLSDNGQSVSYSNEITNYFVNAKDNELFSGFESILARYRRIKVVHTSEL